jgi:hypothetical protein
MHHFAPGYYKLVLQLEGEIMVRIHALVIIACGLGFATGALSQQPTSSELRGVAKSAGAAAAGFAICDDSSKANAIKRKFRDVADACTSTASATNAAINAFDLEYANTLNSFSQVGGRCQGQNRARFDTLIDVLDRAEQSC